MKSTTQGLLVGMLLTLLAPGCADAIAQHNYRADAAAVLATEIELGGNAPAPKPTPGDKCQNCNGTGKLGDGTISVTCPVCDGTGLAVKVEPEPIPEAKVIRRRLPAEGVDPSPAASGRRRLFRGRLFRR